MIDTLDIDDLLRHLPVGQDVRRLAVRVVRLAGQRGGSVFVDLVANLISQANRDASSVDRLEDEREDAVEALEDLRMEISMDGLDWEESLKRYRDAEQTRRKAIDLLIENGINRDEMDNDLLKGIKMLAEREDD